MTSPRVLPQVFFDVTIGGVAAGRIKMELFADECPRTAENFRCLCTGEAGVCSAFGGPPLHFKGNVVHRIVPGQIFQAGDITAGNGTGGESIYGRKFEDESFAGRAGRHRKGLLSMANSVRTAQSRVSPHRPESLPALKLRPLLLLSC